MWPLGRATMRGPRQRRGAMGPHKRPRGFGVKPRLNMVETAIDPWGRSVLTHVAWNILWVSVFVFVTFLVAHASYIILSAHRVRAKEETDALEAKHTDLPQRVKRHTFMARLFHWVVAGAVVTLLGTAFFPIMGWQFNWVDIHYPAGLVLSGAIVFHIFHTTFFLDFWSIWVGPKDIPEFKAEILRERGQEVPGPHSAKYPIGNRLYHLVLTFVGCTVSVTGLTMLWRMGTPFITPNPYILAESTWGWVYVIHGMAGLSLAGLTAAHVIFGLRPKNWWVDEVHAHRVHLQTRVSPAPRTGPLADQEAGAQGDRRPAGGRRSVNRAHRRPIKNSTVLARRRHT